MVATDLAWESILNVSNKVIKNLSEQPSIGEVCNNFVQEVLHSIIYIFCSSGIRLIIQRYFIICSKLHFDDLNDYTLSVYLSRSGT